MGEIAKVRYVLSNARHVRKIRSRQAGAIKKRVTVKHNGVRAQTVRVTLLSDRGQNKKNHNRHRIETMSATRREITHDASVG